MTAGSQTENNKDSGYYQVFYAKTFFLPYQKITDNSANNDTDNSANRISAYLFSKNLYKRIHTDKLKQLPRSEATAFLITKSKNNAHIDASDAIVHTVQSAQVPQPMKSIAP